MMWVLLFNGTMVVVLEQIKLLVGGIDSSKFVFMFSLTDQLIVKLLHDSVQCGVN